MRTTIHFIVLVFLPAFLLFPVMGSAQTTWYVPDDFAGIQLAISDGSVVNGDTVMVRPGTYVENINFIGKAITVKSELGLEVTVIDGDGSGCVVKCESGEGLDSVLDGFTITRGWTTQLGGGMFIEGSSATVINCAFYKNIAGDGGGLTIKDSPATTVTNCTFSENSVPWSGGGMYMLNSSATITNCILSENKTGYPHELGGGMCIEGSSATVINCAFHKNTGGDGGGLTIKDSPATTVTNCTLSENNAFKYSGGMHILNSSATITNCTLSDNTAYEYGGGMTIDSSSPTVINCTFYNNWSHLPGGGLNNVGSSPIVINCIFWGDTAGSPPMPSEIFNDSSSNPTISYCDVQGGCSGTANIDADPMFFDADNGNLHLVSYSPCIDKGINSAPHLPSYDIDGDDRIIDGDEDGTATVDMGVDECLPAPSNVWVDDDWTGLSHGEPVAGHTFRYDAFAKIQYAIHMVAENGTVHVADGVYTGAGNRDLSFKGRALTLTSDNGPAKCIIDCEQKGRGFCFETGEEANSVVDGFTITNGDATDCVFAKRGGGMYIDEASPTINNCIFSENWAYLYGGGMYTLHSSPMITHCEFSGNSSERGGGICNDHSSVTISHCTFSENSAEWDGGGMYDKYSSATFSHCTFSKNSASQGGGMHSKESSATFSHCTFSDNSSVKNGGGIYSYIDSSTLTHCTFSENSSLEEGGGMYCRYSSSTLTQCVFSNNSSVMIGGGMSIGQSCTPAITSCVFTGNSTEEYGGGMSCSVSSSSPSSPMITNCIFSDNTAVDYGGGFYCGSANVPVLTNCTLLYNHASMAGGMYCDGAFPTLTNCIIWGNDNLEIISSSIPDVTITYSNIGGGWPGAGNIEEDPLLVDRPNGDYHLTYLSPCRDAGDNTAVIEAEDFEGDARVTYGTVDMGADEFHPHFYCTGDCTPGGTVEAKIIGQPGTTPVGLIIGSGVLPSPMHCMYGDCYLLPPWLLIELLVPVPADGTIVLSAEIPHTYPAPYDLPIQVLIGNQLSNLFVLEVR